jgi:hypothetical protein
MDNLLLEPETLDPNQHDADQDDLDDLLTWLSRDNTAATSPLADRRFIL